MAELPPQYTAYPRPDLNPGNRPPGIYFETIGEAWKLIQEDLATWVISGFILAACYVLVSIPNYIYNFSMGLSFGSDPVAMGWAKYWEIQGVSMALSAIGSSITFVPAVGLSHMAVRRLRGETIKATDVFAPFKRFLPLVATGWLYYLAVVLGSVACIVPGLYLASALVFSGLIAYDQNVGPMEALQRSFKAMKSNAWMMILLMIVLYVLATCLACVFFFTMPVLAVVIAMHYTYFFPTTTPAASPYYEAFRQ